MNDIKSRLIRLREVEDRVGKKRSSIYQAIKEGTFPAPYPIGLRAVAWLESDIDNWIEGRKLAATR